MQKNSTQLTAKKTRLTILGAVLSVFILGAVLNSCTKQTFPKVVSVTSAEFVNGYLGVGSYYLKSNNAPFAIPVGFTNTSGSDRTLTFTTTSKTATLGTQYTAPATSVTVKAGQTLDSLMFTGIFSGYPTGRKDTMVVTCTTTGFPFVNGQSVYKFVVQAYCDVVQANLIGDYTTTTDYYPAVGSGPSASKYTANISNWTPLTATTANITIKNLGRSPDTGFGPFQASDPAATGLTAKLDWTNPANFTITLATQSYMASLYTYGAATISGSGTWSACDQKFTLGYSVKVAAGSFTNQWTVLTR